MDQRAHCPRSFPAAGGMFRLFFALLLVAPRWLLAQPTVPQETVPQYSSRVWQVEDGLPHNIVQAITQTRDGYLWVGTREGLARFDGVRFTPVALTSETSVISIKTLRETQDGSLWVGTEDAGLFQMKHGKMTRYTKGDGLPSNSVRGIEEGTDGTVWILSAKGMVHFRDGRVSRPSDKGLSEDSVFAIHLGRKGSMWVASDRGLTEFRAQGTTQPTQVIGSPVRTIYEARNGDVWLGLDRGVARIRDGIPAIYPRERGPKANVNAIGEDRWGDIWIGTYSGLEQWLGESFDAEEATGKVSLKIYTIFADREQNLWVGSEEGLHCFSPKRFTSYTRHEGLTHDRTMSVCEGRDGSIWIGTWGGGVNRLKDGKLTAYTKANGLASDLTYSVYPSRDGSLWVGLSVAPWGVQRLKDGQWTHFGASEGLLNVLMAVIHEDRQGTLWAGGSAGVLYRLKDEQWVPCQAGDGVPAGGICALCERRDSGLWIGTEGGLAYWSEDRFTRFTVGGRPLQDHVFSLHEDADGTLWIGTNGKGLKRFKQGKLDTFTIREGLGSDAIYAILEDDRGSLWMSGSRGIFRVSKAELEQVAAGKVPSVKSVGYGKADGIVSSSQYTAAVQPAGWKGADGRLWFRTTQGVVVTDPNHLADNTRPPPVVIEEVLVDKRLLVGGSFPVSNPDRPVRNSNQPAATPNLITIPPGHRELEFRYTALSLQTAEQNRFKYRLEGVDSEWVDAGTRRFVSYRNVSPGSYQFRVLASNNDGVWNETGASLTLVLQAYYWQTGWFRFLCSVTVACSLAGIVRYVTRKRMQQKLERLEQQHAIERERSRIARDMHDELGAKLTRISFQGATAKRSLANPIEAGEQIEKMSQTARELVLSLDEIVWAVDPENDSLDHLVTYICHYAGEFFADGPIRCQLVIPPKLPPCHLTTDVRHNVFLAVKEALNNAFKHSQASQVEIRISVAGDEFEILISDDGRGLHPSDASERPGRKIGRAGHGLVNFNERLAAIHGRCDVDSEPGRGTRLRFRVPLAPAAEAPVMRSPAD